MIDTPHRGEVLVAILPDLSDLTIAREQHWYRIPVSSVKKFLKERWPPDWLAFYQPKVFQAEQYSVRYYAQGVKANVLFFDRKPAREEPWTKRLWIYDLRTNEHFTLKRHPLTREDLDDFVACYNPENRHGREETWSEENSDRRWRAYDYEELVARDKANLDIFWIRDESLEETANLPEPEVLAADIVEDLESALEQFRLVAEDLGE
jgi:hypothetical protein